MDGFMISLQGAGSIPCASSRRVGRELVRTLLWDTADGEVAGAEDARPLAFDGRAASHQDCVVGRGCVISRSAAGLAVPETLREQVRIASLAFGTRHSSWNKKIVVSAQIALDFPRPGSIAVHVVGPSWVAAPPGPERGLWQCKHRE